MGTLSKMSRLRSKIQTIEEALSNYLSKERINDLSVGSKRVGGTRVLQFQRLPKCLVLHLKMFAHQNNQIFKIRKRLKFSPDLVVKKKFMHASQADKCSTYDLRSVVVH